MIKSFLFFNFFIFIHSLNVFNLTQNYSKGDFKNIILKDEFFFINTDKFLYKSLVSNGLNMGHKISLNYSENSSIIFISELDILVAACTKDFFIGIINSSLNYIEIYNDEKNHFLEDENKCNLYYYFSNENVHYLFLIKNKNFYFYKINDTSKKFYSNQTSNFQNEDFNVTNFALFNYENLFYFSLFYNSTEDKKYGNVIYLVNNFSKIEFYKNISLDYIFPINSFKFNNSGIFYGLNLTNYVNIIFSIPKFEIETNSNEITNITSSNFYIKYDGYIKNHTAYKTIKAVYIEGSHLILNYLYTENILKVKIIDIFNGKEIINFKLKFSFENNINNYFNFILSNNYFSYFLSTENNEKYYFILSSENCDVEHCGICFSSLHENLNNQCIKCDDKYYESCVNEDIIIKTTKTCYKKTDNVPNCYFNDDNSEFEECNDDIFLKLDVPMKINI